MTSTIDPILRIPESVIRDISGYRAKVNQLLAGDTSPLMFRAYRVPMGVYEQRTPGRYMVRTRIGAGLVLPEQLARVAELSKQYGDGVLHVTTRQALQIHDVDIADTPDIIERLLEVGLCSRGGGGNTVRNITASPRTGVDPDDVFDVAPYAIALAEYLLQFPSSFNLPRKYKIAFSSSANDDAFASVTDLGFFARVRDGEKGFSVYSAGGMGSNPRVGIRIEDFVSADAIFDVAEAIRRVFDAHGDRNNKHRARLRYVLEKIGEAEFIRLYREQRDILRQAGLPGKVPEIRDILSRFPLRKNDSGHGRINALTHPGHIYPEKTLGYVSVRVKLPQGDISADDAVIIGQIADEYGQGLVRLTQYQDMLITGVGEGRLDTVFARLNDLNVDVPGDNTPTVVACTGASTCKLGMCLSRGLADAVTSRLAAENISDADTVIRISGCPNSCADHYIADIGFQGKAVRHNGKLIPSYDVLAGAVVHAGKTRLAQPAGTVPAKRIPDMLADYFQSAEPSPEKLHEIVAKYADVPDSPPEDYYRDFGQDTLFSLAGRGPGECGAGVLDVVKLDIDAALKSLKTLSRPGDEADNNATAYHAIISAMRALLVIFGLEPKKDREVFSAFREHLIQPGWVAPDTGKLIDAAIDWKVGDRNTLLDLTARISEMVTRVESLFKSLDSRLKFTISPIRSGNALPESKAPSRQVDLLGVACPMNFVKAKIELEKIAVGETIEILLDDGEPARNVPASFQAQGQEVVEMKPCAGHHCLTVRRKK